ncbi:hypothetical protein Hanom_Chr16g01469341 [Helianthus anomalus]
MSMCRIWSCFESVPSPVILCPFHHHHNEPVSNLVNKQVWKNWSIGS